MFFISVSYSGTLVFGTRVCCTRHPRLLLELTLSLEYSPRLPHASEPSGTPHTTSYHLHPFSLGHPILLTHALDVTARCSILERQLTCDKTIGRARGWWVVVFSIQSLKKTKKPDKFQPRKGFSTLPGRGWVNVRVRSFHMRSRGVRIGHIV